MPVYQYQAMNAAGQELKEQVEAANADEAVAKIRAKGLFLLKIRETSKGGKAKKSKGAEPAQAAAAAKRKVPGSQFGTVSVKQVTQFTRQLSTLQDAGLPILRSLRILEQQQKPGLLKTIIRDVGEDVEGGMTLSEAMGRHPKAFDRLYANMVQAGEAGGVLDVILQRLADFMEKAQKLKRQVVGAMIYPAAVMTFAVGIVTGIMIVVVPKFTEIFSDFGEKLPGPTLLLMNISDWFVIKGGWVVVLITPPSVILMLRMMKRADNAISGALQILKYVLIVMAVGAVLIAGAGLLIFMDWIEGPFQQVGAVILTIWGSAQLYALMVVLPVCGIASAIGKQKGATGSAVAAWILPAVIVAPFILRRIFGTGEGDEGLLATILNNAYGHQIVIQGTAIGLILMGGDIGYGIDKMLLALPVVGGILSKTSIARFSRTLGTLISAGVPILEALNITKETSGNRVYGHALGLVHDSIRQGETFAGPLRQTKVCDNLVVNMIDVGEETGDLDKMLMKVADNYDEEVEVLVAGLVSLLEPVMVIFLGVIVGFIVISLFLPMVSLINSVSGSDSGG